MSDSPVSELNRSSADCAWGDYDNDGHLDLIVANRDHANELYHNDGNGGFTRIDTGVVVTDNRNMDAVGLIHSYSRQFSCRNAVRL